MSRSPAALPCSATEPPRMLPPPSSSSPPARTSSPARFSASTAASASRSAHAPHAAIFPQFSIGLIRIESREGKASLPALFIPEQARHQPRALHRLILIQVHALRLRLRRHSLILKSRPRIRNAQALRRLLAQALRDRRVRRAHARPPPFQIVGVRRDKVDPLLLQHLPHQRLRLLPKPPAQRRRRYLHQASRPHPF